MSNPNKCQNGRRTPFPTADFFDKYFDEMSEAKAGKSGSIIPNPANLECKDLQEYLKSRQQDVLEKLQLSHNLPQIYKVN